MERGDGHASGVESISEIGGYVTAAKAANILGLTDSHVRRLVITGLLRAKRWEGKALMVERASVEEYKAQPRHPGPSKGNSRTLRP